MAKRLIRYVIKVQGMVQGIGFRPFVANLASSLGIKGTVRNTGAAVLIEVEGRPEATEEFLLRLKREAPPLAHIRFIDVTKAPVMHETEFSIAESAAAPLESVFPLPDLGICAECERELFEPHNRRYRYPLINCTQCGPRFTITEKLPYDRKHTSMKAFPLCPACHREYTDPMNRRYHAEPISCPQCGPGIRLLDGEGRPIETSDLFNQLHQALLQGKVVAVKGIGGFHLMCDAKSEEAVQRLRRRKKRDPKPLALMIRDIETIRKYCHLSIVEERILASEKRPILLLRKKDTTGLADGIAPNNRYLGIMLPYTPIHHLLFHTESPREGNSLDSLVATSGNLSHEPISYRDAEAVSGLAGIADYLLLHDREILVPADDSVLGIFRGEEYPLRRARGYVPLPVDCAKLSSLWESEKKPIPSILACGGQLKNTFCINQGKQFFLSQHIGDLENLKTYEAFIKGIAHFQSLLGVIPEAVAFDRHPDYLSTEYASSSDIPIKIPIQHHKAHIASCMADNGLDEKVIGVAFDGSGYGEDGAVWGGEFFVGDYNEFTRFGHFEYVKMPGGDAAVREPWRMALAYIYGAGLPLESAGTFYGVKIRGVPFLNAVPSDKIWMVHHLLSKDAHSPLTSSVGRLFDGVSALLGIQSTVYYEGQAAVTLENMAVCTDDETYPIILSKDCRPFVIGWRPMVQEIVSDMAAGVPASRIAGKFHRSVARSILEACLAIALETGLTKVVLGGGVFQNMILLQESVRLLETHGFQVFVHHQVPTNDGGIALGQAVMAMAHLKKITSDNELNDTY